MYLRPTTFENRNNTARRLTNNEASQGNMDARVETPKSKPNMKRKFSGGKPIPPKKQEKKKVYATTPLVTTTLKPQRNYTNKYPNCNVCNRTRTAECYHFTRCNRKWHTANLCRNVTTTGGNRNFKTRVDNGEERTCY